MNILDSKVEALAFNYLTFGFLTALNNCWTWLALLTAALSFWKIRASGCPKPRPDYRISLGPDPAVEELTTDEVTVEKAEPTWQTAVSHGVTEDVDGVRKGKFSVYFYEEEDAQCACGESEGLTALDAWRGSETEWWKRWEGLLRLRNGESEKGWYTWQDLTELNGNVVRLWDGGNNSSCISVW